MIRSELGTMTVVRSNVWISVARTRIRRMSPSTPPTLTQSPTFTGRSISRMRPETKFWTTCCSPNPMPTDSALAINAICLKPRPIAARAEMMARPTPK